MIKISLRTTHQARLKDDLEKTKKKLLLDLHSELVHNTPVDTGRLRGGWTVDTGAGRIENNVEYGNAVNDKSGFVETAVDKIAKLSH